MPKKQQAARGRPSVSSRPAVPSRIAFEAADTRDARAARAALVKRYGICEPDQAETIVALGGDGFMLETLHRHMARRVPIYGMNKGSIGFLMNEYRIEG